MEKLSIEKFREYCEFTQDLDELLKDESKQEGMSDEEFEELQTKFDDMIKKIKTSDLREIPFEEWKGFILIEPSLDLANTGAQIDFDFITIPPELTKYERVKINLKGCTVRNFNFDKKIFEYSDDSFDPEFVKKAIEKNKKLFPETKITDSSVRERLRRRKITLSDIKQQKMQEYITLNEMETSTRYIVEKIGLDKALEIDDEIINDKLLFEKFSVQIYHLEGEYDYESVKSAMFAEIARTCSGYGSETEYQKYENNQYVTQNLPEIFVKFPEGKEDLEEAFKSSKLRFHQLVDNYELFKEKRILPRLIANGYFGLNESYPNLTDEKIKYFIEKFPDIVEIYKYEPSFIYRIANDIDISKEKDEIRDILVEKITQRVLKEGVKDKRVLDIIPYRDIALGCIKEEYTAGDAKKILEDDAKIELLKQKGISPNLLANTNFVRTISIFGIRTLFDFDDRNGNFLTKNECDVLLSLYEKFLNYAGNTHDVSRKIYVKGYNLQTLEYIGSDLEEYTKEEFEEAFRRMIIYGPTDSQKRENPLPFWEMQGEFRENNPDLFVSENVPEYLATRFYQGTFNLDDIRFGKEEDEPAIREILSKNKNLMFRRTDIRFDIEKMDSKIIFSLAKQFGSYMNYIKNIDFEGKSLEEVQIMVMEKIEQGILSGKIPYGEMAPEYIKERNPNLFLSADVPEELKRIYYRKNFEDEYIDKPYWKQGTKELRIYYFIKNPKYIEILKDKNLKFTSLEPSLKNFIELFGQEEFFRLLEKDPKAIQIISDAGVDKIVRFKKLLETRPDFYAQKELRENDGYTEDEVNLILSGKETQDERILKGRELLKSKRQKFRDFIISSPGYVVHCPNEKLDEFNFTEYKELEKISKFEISAKYRRDTAEQIITSMYCFLGYGLSKEVMKLPEVTEEELQEAIRNTGVAVSGIYENIYLVQGNLKVLSALFDKFEPMLSGDKKKSNIYKTLKNKLKQGYNGSIDELVKLCLEENNYSSNDSTLEDELKNAVVVNSSGKIELIKDYNGGKKKFDVYKTLNEKLENGYDGPIDELLRLCLVENTWEFEDSRLETVVQNAIAVNANGKIGFIENYITNYLRNNIHETPENIKILNDILNTALKRAFLQKEGIDLQIIQDYIQNEFSRKKPDGTSFYSPHVTDHMRDLMSIVTELQNNPEFATKLNMSVTDILKQEKQRIDKGWIRKLLDIKTRLTEKEKTELEKRLYGIESTYNIEAEKILELKDKSEAGIEETYTLLKEMELPGIFTIEKGEIMFAGLTPPYSENFKKFFIANMTEIMSKPEYYTQFQNMHKRIESVIKDPNISERFNSGKYTVKELLDDIKNIFYDNIEDGEYELAYRAKKAGLLQEEFNVAKQIYKKMLEREKQTVPPVEHKGKRYVGRILRLDDPLHITIGNITTCCQRVGEGQPGESSMIHSATEENGSVFVVEEVDEYGNVVKIVAQSWTWRNGDRVCFDNVEIPDTINGELGKNGGYEEIFQIYRSVSEKMIDIDKKTLGRFLKEGKITQEQYDTLVIKQVTVGSGCDDLLCKVSEESKKGIKKATTVLPAEKGKHYSGINKDRKLYVDSNVQYVLAENDEVYETDVEKTGIILDQISFGYIKKRESIRRKDSDIHKDLVRRCKAINERAGEEIVAQSIMSKLDTNNIMSLSTEDYSELSGRTLTLDFSESDDWYILTSEGEKDIEINDSILLPKESDSQDEIKLAKMEYTKQILLIAKQAMEKGKSLSVNLEREGKFLEFDKLVESGILTKKEDGRIGVKDSEKLEELLKKLDEKIQEDRDKRLVDTAVCGVKNEEGQKTGEIQEEHEERE